MVKSVFRSKKAQGQINRTKKRSFVEALSINTASSQHRQAGVTGLATHGGGDDVHVHGFQLRILGGDDYDGE